MNIGWQSGFDSIMKKRETMHHWKQLQHLMIQGSNREAAAIVQSFEIQMDFETHQLFETYQHDQRLAS
jgi:hypothetical protein